jgi:hypothetical protein
MKTFLAIVVIVIITVLYLLSHSKIEEPDRYIDPEAPQTSSEILDYSGGVKD